jgi:hypothetical protein
LGPNNSFKPTQLRYGFAVAEEACHCKAFTTPVGLTQVLAAMGPAVFAAGSFLCLSLAAAIAVYGFDFVEPMWGHSGSFTVLFLIAAACAFGACLAFGLSSALARRFAPAFIAAKLGALVSAVAITVFAGVAHLIHGGAGFMAGLAVLVVGSCLAPFGFRAKAANNSSKPTPLPGRAKHRC